MLDIGAFSGAWSFAAEDNGAKVVSLDVLSPYENGYAEFHDIRKSNCIHCQCSVYDLNPFLFPKFGFVFFAGTLYHLKHPVLALERVNKVMRESGLLYLASVTCDPWIHDDKDGTCSRGFSPSETELYKFDGIKNEKEVRHVNDLPISMFAGQQYFRDHSNWFIPSLSTMKSMVEAAGFKVLKTDLTFQVLPREWNKNNLKRGLGVVLAQKISDPKPEYRDEVYSINRTKTDKNTKTYQYEIPYKF